MWKSYRGTYPPTSVGTQIIKEVHTAVSNEPIPRNLNFTMLTRVPLLRLNTAPLRLLFLP